MVITYLHTACTKIYSYGNLSLNVDGQNTPKHGLIFFNLAWRLCARLVASLPDPLEHESEPIPEKACTHTRINTHHAVVYLDPNWTCEISSSCSSSESSSSLSWDMSERAKNRNEKGLTGREKNRWNERKTGRKEDDAQAWRGRKPMGGKKASRQMWNSNKQKKGNEKGSTGKMHASWRLLSLFLNQFSIALAHSC